MLKPVQIAFASIVLVGCVPKLDRYDYVDVYGANVEISEEALLEIEDYIGSRGPIPTRYIIEFPSEGIRVHLHRNVTNPYGGLTITAQTKDGVSIALERTQEPLYSPNTGGQCAGYNILSSYELLFSDLCPKSSQREYKIGFGLLLPSEPPRTVELKYAVKSLGYNLYIDAF